jgi:hypothetical protein
MNQTKQLTTHMQTEKTDVLALVLKALLKVLPPFIVGLTAKIANDRLEGRKLSIWGWIAIACLTLSGTFLSNWMCELYELGKNPTVIINAFATMFSEQIFRILFHNSYGIIRKLVKENMKFSLKMIDESEDQNTLRGGSDNRAGAQSTSADSTTTPPATTPGA